eukprot:5418540-Alexandrium_andersonii.AAC.1
MRVRSERFAFREPLGPATRKVILMPVRLGGGKGRCGGYPIQGSRRPACRTSGAAGQRRPSQRGGATQKETT